MAILGIRQKKLPSNKILPNFLFKGFVGFSIVIILLLLAQSDQYYIAGLIPLFPSFAIVAHVIVYKENGLKAVKETILFGMFSIIPYFLYLITLYLLIDLIDFYYAILLSILSWILFAFLLITYWNEITIILNVKEPSINNKKDKI